MARATVCSRSASSKWYSVPRRSGLLPVHFTRRPRSGWTISFIGGASTARTMAPQDKASTSLWPKPSTGVTQKVKERFVLQAEYFLRRDEVAQEADVGRADPGRNAAAGEGEARPFGMPRPNSEHARGQAGNVAGDHEEFAPLLGRGHRAAVETGEAAAGGARAGIAENGLGSAGLAEDAIKAREGVDVLLREPFLVRDEHMAPRGVEHLARHPFEKDVEIGFRLEAESVGSALQDRSDFPADFLREAAAAVEIGIDERGREAGLVEQVDDDPRVVHQAIGVVLADDVDGGRRWHPRVLARMPAGPGDFSPFAPEEAAN